MSLEEGYNRMGGDYPEVMNRLLKEERVVRFLQRFKEKLLWEALETALEQRDWTEVFQVAHNLKGICQNLSMKRLADSSSELCEAVRDGKPSGDITVLAEQVKSDYALTIQVLEEVL